MRAGEKPSAGVERRRPSKQVLFVQGGGRGAHDDWDNKLVESLGKELGGGYDVRYPRMPDEADPDAMAWKKAIAREIGELRDGDVVVGHSIGAAVLIDHLADGAVQRRLAGIFLIASPYIGEGGWPSDDLRPSRELTSRLPAGTPVYLYQGSKDETVPCSHLELLARALPDATIRRLDGRDHQLDDDLSEVAHDIARLVERPRSA
jgi:predicted alpha/beta hydrolase family esterase